MKIPKKMVSFWGDMLIFGGVNLLDFGTLRITKVFRAYPPGGTITYGNSSTQTCFGLGYDDMLVLTGGYLRSTIICTLPETNSSPLKIDGWKTHFHLGPGLFSGANC